MEENTAQQEDAMGLFVRFVKPAIHEELIL